MRSNTHSNNLIKDVVILGDFLLLNVLLLLFSQFFPPMEGWAPAKVRLFIITTNFALVIGHVFWSPVVHLRLISVGDIVRRVMGLVAVTILVAYLMMKGISLHNTRVGMQLMFFGTVYGVSVLISRYIERYIIKKYRQ